MLKHIVVGPGRWFLGRLCAYVRSRGHVLTCAPLATPSPWTHASLLTFLLHAAFCRQLSCTMGYTMGAFKCGATLVTDRIGKGPRNRSRPRHPREGHAGERGELPPATKGPLPTGRCEKRARPRCFVGIPSIPCVTQSTHPPYRGGLLSFIRCARSLLSMIIAPLYTSWAWVSGHFAQHATVVPAARGGTLSPKKWRNLQRHVPPTPTSTSRKTYYPTPTLPFALACVASLGMHPRLW